MANITRLFLGMIALWIVGCQGPVNDELEEMGQGVGDLMASIDEVGGNTGEISWETTTPFLKFQTSPLELIPSAHAASCLVGTFGLCATNTIVRSFNRCNFGSVILNGSVTLTWGGGAANCQLLNTGDTLTRVPNFTLTGRRSGTLEVTKTGTIGQRLTWMSGTGANKVFEFTNDGIRRVYTDFSGDTAFDLLTETTSAITVTGTQRANRTLEGGGFRVTNQLTNLACTFTPSGVTWSTVCNCPISGSWTGSCGGNEATLSITGCGTANFSSGSETISLRFDRCIGL